MKYRERYGKLTNGYSFCKSEENMKKAIDPVTLRNQEKPSIKEPPTLDYSNMKPPQKPHSPTQDYSTHVAPKESDIKKQDQIKNKMIARHSKSPDNQLVTGRNKEIYVVQKPTPLQKASDLRERVDALKAKYQPPKEPSFSDKIKAIKAKYKPQPLKKDNEPHPAGSPADSAHDTVEENSPLNQELKGLKSHSEKVSFFAHLKTLVGKKNLRSPKNEEIGRD